jgi:hypothetical protein
VLETWSSSKWMHRYAVGSGHQFPSDRDGVLPNTHLPSPTGSSPAMGRCKFVAVIKPSKTLAGAL